MSYKLIITEKPSVAKDIAKVLGVTKRKNGYFEGNGYKITWCVGHLVGLSYPEDYDQKLKIWRVDTLPIIPNKMKYKVLPNTMDQFNIINTLVNDDSTESLICATDSGREGELIFRLVYRMAKTKKSFERLWISSQTDQAIIEGFENLKPGTNYNPLFNSAISRAVADWLIGINATRYFSVQYNTMLSIGRVQTPTLAMIVDRYNEILNFVPEMYYELEGDFEGYKGTWKNEAGTKLKNENDVLDLIEKLKGKPAFVEALETSKKAKTCPLLYDLTELQVQANKKFGYSIKETLDIAQALYEKHKVTTYPRTDSRYISDDMIPKLKPLLANIQREDLKVHVSNILDKELTITKRIVDNKKITDHHAIIPTEKVANINAFNEQEKNIYNMIIDRFVAVFMPKYEYNETNLTTIVENERFYSKGSSVINLGWREIEAVKDAKEIIFPPLTLKQEVNVIGYNKVDKTTKPKKYYTEGTLVSAMANIGRTIDDEVLKEQLKDKGLGTPATRANILEKLFNVGYIKREKNNILPTSKGLQTVSIIPDYLKSAAVTGEWEFELNQIARGEGDMMKFMNGIKDQVRKIIDVEINNTVKFEDSGNDSREVIAVCPRCNRNIYENAKSFSCSGWKCKPKCTYALWKDDKILTEKGIVLNRKEAKELIANNNIKITSQPDEQGKSIDYTLSLEENGRYLNYKLTLVEQ
ncbi:MAG: DNA topoisomerase 3 [Clostridiales bacterium]|nr:DNA topoisomerase 3 [Clostridiales bacterium]